jgi:hypothetical protein
MTETNAPSIETTSTASDNVQAVGLNSYSAAQVGELFTRTPTRIAQIARAYGIGERFGKKIWRFSFEDIMLLEKHLRREKRMKDVTPRTVEPGAQPDIYEYLKGQLDRLRRDGFRTLNDVWVGLNNRVTKEVQHLDYSIEDLRRRVKALEGKEEERGRGVLCLGRAALPTLHTYEAEAA